MIFVRRFQLIGMALTLLAGGLLGGTAAVLGDEQEPTLALDEQTTITFVSVERGKKLIGTPDRFTKRLGQLEMQLRMGSPEPVSMQAFLDSLSDGVQAWSPADIQIVTQAVETLREPMQAYRLPFPEQINLIRANAQVAQNAPHCRGANIVLPDRYFADPTMAPVILAHELFHVLSSHNPELRDRLYQIIHFERTNEIRLPTDLEAQRLTNPDAPVNEHVVHLRVDGERTAAVPVILTQSKEFRPGGVFGNLDLKIMLLDEQDGEYVPKLVDGEPQLLAPTKLPDYLQQIGRNTRYIIHPEETLADNFWMMLLGSDKVQDEWVIDEMKSVLAR